MRKIRKINLFFLPIRFLFLTVSFLTDGDAMKFIFISQKTNSIGTIAEAAALRVSNIVGDATLSAADAVMESAQSLLTKKLEVPLLVLQSFRSLDFFFTVQQRMTFSSARSFLRFCNVEISLAFSSSFRHILFFAQSRGDDFLP